MNRLKSSQELSDLLETRTHTTRRPCSSVLSSVVPSCFLCLSVPSSQPLSPVAHASSTPSQGKPAETLLVPPPAICSEFRLTLSHSSTRRSPAHTNLSTFLQTRKHQVAGANLPHFFRKLEKFSRVSVRSRPFPEIWNRTFQIFPLFSNSRGGFGTALERTPSYM